MFVNVDGEVFENYIDVLKYLNGLDRKNGTLAGTHVRDGDNTKEKMAVAAIIKNYYRVKEEVNPRKDSETFIDRCIGEWL